MALRVLTWNLMHGRSVPGAGRDLCDAFSAALAAWEWDLALLQEVPPWWGELLAPRCRATARSVLTSRNSLLAARRAVAVRWPDVIKSNGGGSNAILVRAEVLEHRTLRLCRRPERRWLHAVRLRSGEWVGNVHLTVRNDARARGEAAVAARAIRDWAGPAGAAILGGDFNVRGLELDGFALIGRSDVDYVFAAGPQAGDPAVVLERGALSDHAPLLVSVRQTR